MTPLEIALLIQYGGFKISELEPETDLRRFLRNADPNKVKRFYQRCGEEEIIKQKDLVRKYNVKLVSFWDEAYPDPLKNMKSPPVVLFVRGNEKLLRERCVSVVGTRRPTAYGVSVTKRFVKMLSEHFVVVSGMALGIDSVAHRTALENGGRTLAVLGTGVDKIYPKTNEQLLARILKNGCVVSEYVMGTNPKKHHFPARNRIIAGLSEVVIVTEAPAKSGAILTAKFAIDNGRDVFAIPGDIDRKTSEGTNYLIKSGAYPLTCEEDLIFYFGITRKSSFSVNQHQREIYELLKVSPKSVDDLAEELGWEISEVLKTISEMEIMGLIESTGGIYRALG
ncbi:DNA-processing protein DprA [Thermotoga sp. KOL6]|uniref:DNA-processing protein DprA n=1 Tax=Thermotoga sp. KOL6 TaxID=126741 RepID=UPI000C761068|nr:DNA-processing protein DprA [Thermotoga sp. KOL6]PLV59005.1 DNA processing protein DprA [Thermotoga sp. KOL6]